MLPNGIHTQVEFFQTVISTSTTPSSWLVQVNLPGQSKTVGDLPGERMVTLDWLREIHAMFAILLHSLFDHSLIITLYLLKHHK